MGRRGEGIGEEEGEEKKEQEKVVGRGEQPQHWSLSFPHLHCSNLNYQCRSPHTVPLGTTRKEWNPLLGGAASIHHSIIQSIPFIPHHYNNTHVFTFSQTSKNSVYVTAWHMRFAVCKQTPGERYPTNKLRPSMQFCAIDLNMALQPQAFPVHLSMLSDSPVSKV